MTSILKKVKCGAAALTLVAAAAGVHAATVGMPVTVQESAIPGAVSNLIEVDQLSGQYDEVLTVHTPTFFTTEAIFNAGGWFRNSNPVPNQIGALGGYNLYAKFTGDGNFVANGTGGFDFNGGNGYLELWADPNQDTDYNVAGSAAFAPSVNNLLLASGAGSITDDFMLGSASTVSAAQGQTSAGLANGNFELVFSDFSLTAPAGEAYFTAPRPFYMVLDLNGNFQSFTPSVGNSAQLLNSSANAFFASSEVPEPSALALVGLALLGMGLVGRSRKA